MVSEQSQQQTVVSDKIAISFEDYLTQFDGQRCEWLNGEVIFMSPVSDEHNRITIFLINFLSAYFDLNPIGVFRTDPFVMRLPNIESARQPDVQIILNEHVDALQPSYMNGAADIAIEVVSPESVERDHGTKFSEYEKGGVQEYWILDPIHRECRFYRLDETGTYRRVENTSQSYTTPLLPKFNLPVSVLWQDQLPTFYQIAQLVQAMLQPDDKANPTDSAEYVE